MSHRPARETSVTLPLQHFWRNAELPFIEAREVSDGRQICYERHAHHTFSIGAITGGYSSYVNEGLSMRIEAGTLVIINPGAVHACNPIDDQPWSYIMLYVDAQWLAAMQQECAPGQTPLFQPYSVAQSREVSLYAGLLALHRTLTDDEAEVLEKESAAVAFFSDTQRKLAGKPEQPVATNPRLALAADFIRSHCTQALRLDEICAAAELSASYLIRAFKARYAMTPHEYLTNCRIEFSRTQLKQGMPLASVAAEAGFADQAHFNRAFKRLVAATPGQYRATPRR